MGYTASTYRPTLTSAHKS
uniref:Uncharacterized protein n=1 Tax=Anguilla anguilla TaxID=7936 RepID=A0A0E9P6B3_ANGAN